MKIVFVLYDNLTLLDFAGAYDPVTRLMTMGFIEDLSCDVCARKDSIRSFESIELIPGLVNNDLSGYDYVIIPGSDGIKDLMKDTEFLRWIPVALDTTVIAAVCGAPCCRGTPHEKGNYTSPADGFFKTFRKGSFRRADH